jgi:hypothetical protein
VDLPPSTVEQVPAFDVVRPWLKDAAPAGAGVHLAGRLQSHSLVLFPRTRLTYELGEGYDLFVATIGIESRSTGPAHALFQVFADGERIFQSQPVTRDSAPEELRLPITGAKELAIEVDFGRNFDLGDHCVFAGARLLREPR